MTQAQATQAILKALQTTGFIGKLTAQGGTVIVDDTNPHTVNAASLMAQSATVISACTGVDSAGTAVNFKSTYNWVTLVAGIPIIAPDNYRITSITLTSGSVALYS